MTFDTAGKSMMGVSPEDFAERIGSQNVIAVGLIAGLVLPSSSMPFSL